MQATLDQFRQNLNRARALLDLALFLGAGAPKALDVTDIYRTALVLGVSGLDYFIHEIVRAGMIQVLEGHRVATDAYLAFRVPLGAANAGAFGNNSDWLQQAVRDAHSWLSFQHPDKIADAIRLISNLKLWESVASQHGGDPKAIKAQLASIVDRRNKIAHEADMDPTNVGSRWPIDAALVRDAIDFIERIGESIFKSVA